MAQTQEGSPRGELPGAETPGEGESDTLDRGQIFEILSNDRRRYVIHYLKQQSDETTIQLREIVDQVAAWENGIDVSGLDSSDRKTVYTALKQTHLPRLDEFGVVEYDQQRGEVILTETADQVQLYMEYVPEDDISWSQYYLGLSGLCILISTGAWTGLPLLASTSWISLSGLFVGAFAVSSALHLYRSRKNRIGSDGPLREMERKSE